MTHPAELSDFDLYQVWTTADDLTGRFDPFRFDQRMAAYRMMIDRSNTNGLFGVDNRHNPMWGLMFQHQWQFRTGRLGFDSVRDGRIDPDSPWGYGNYTLCVVPWLGAEAAGLVPHTTIAAPQSKTRFRYVSGDLVPDELRPGVPDWQSYFELVKASSPDADREPIRRALWKAHKTCLDVVVDAIDGIDPAPYSALELAFLRGWCRMVDYLWVAAWPTDFGFMAEHGMDVLPEQLLQSHADLATLPERVRRNVANIVRLAHTPTWRYNVNLALWKRVMRTRAARDEVLPLLDAVFNPRPDNLRDRLRMLGYLVKP